MTLPGPPLGWSSIPETEGGFMFAGEEGRGAANSDMSEASMSSCLEETPELREDRPGLDMMDSLQRGQDLKN